MHKQLNSEIELLSELLPESALNNVHGDAYIEATEIMQKSVGHETFCNWIAELTTPQTDACSELHKSIRELSPRGIVTFNYDQCHEYSYAKAKLDLTTALYNEDDKLKEFLNKGFESPFLIKAHGCISKPDSLVLTRSSYNEVLNNYRVYRAVLQHLMSRFTVLIVGFSLRDRDFDQMLYSIEKDFGACVQDHIVIVKKPVNGSTLTLDDAVKKSNYAVLQTRYGIHTYGVEDYADQPKVLSLIKQKPRKWLKDIIERAVDNEHNERAIARSELQELSEIGKELVKEELKYQLKNSPVVANKTAELIYLIGRLRVIDYEFVIELLKSANMFIDDALNLNDKLVHIDCLAHLMTSIRTLNNANNQQLKEISKYLCDDTFIVKLRELDEWLKQTGDSTPRLEAYAKAALAEILERSRL